MTEGAHEAECYNIRVFSDELPDWLGSRPELSSDAKLVYLALLRSEHCAEQGDGVYSYSKVVEARPGRLVATGLPGYKVARAFRELERSRICTIDASGRAYFFIHEWMDRQTRSFAALSARSAPRSVRPKEPREGHIYFVRRGAEGPIKIGFSTNVRARIKALQTGCAETLSLLGVVRGPLSLEADLHERFAAHRTGGEWFAPHPDLIAFTSGLDKESL